MGDPLFNLRNAFYLGAYSTAVAEASSLDLPSHSSEAIERDCILYRAAIAQGTPEIALNEIQSDAPSGLQAVKLYAQYIVGENKEAAVAELTELASDPACSGNSIVQVMAATVHAAEGSIVDALKYCASSQSLELLALSAQLLVAMDRADVAEKQLKTMTAIDDDDTLTQLSTAYVGIALGGAKLQEASYIFQELGDKFTVTVSIINGSAACMMKMGRYDDAEKELLEALAKDSKNPETLANLYVCSLHLGKPPTRYINQLKMVNPTHPLVLKSDAMSKTFDEVTA